MKKLFKIIVAASIAVAGFMGNSCSKYDDSAILKRLEGIEGRVSALEKSMQQLADYQSIKDKVNAGILINEVTNNADGSNTIKFSDGSAITIYSGKDGADGKDGATPSFKIENETWYVSYDNGATWKAIGSAIDKSLFSAVSVVGEYLYLTLADGTKVTLPIGKKVVFSMQIDENEIDMAADPQTELTRTVEIPYTLTGAIGEPRFLINWKYIANDATSGVKVQQIASDNKSGVIKIEQNPAFGYISDEPLFDLIYAPATIDIIVFNGDGQSCYRSISVRTQTWEFYFEDPTYSAIWVSEKEAKLNKVVPKEGCEITLYFFTSHTILSEEQFKDMFIIVHGYAINDSTVQRFTSVTKDDWGYKATMKIAPNASGTTKNAFFYIYKLKSSNGYDIVHTNWKVSYTQAGS